ncbi:hypothetical protein FB451DRAFT_1471317 [Mycena latifolia]|nr:hypothetical protein FB451DRAFT_1471317 [Mycena latifolia]
MRNPFASSSRINNSGVEPQPPASTSTSIAGLPALVLDLSNATTTVLEARAQAEERMNAARIEYDGHNITVSDHVNRLLDIAAELKLNIGDARASLAEAQQRELLGEPNIRARHDAVLQLEREIEGVLGADAMATWKSSLGRGEHKKAALPSAMDGVFGTPLKAYIGGPQDRTGSAGSSKGAGGVGDVAPQSCEIGGGGM